MKKTRNRTRQSMDLRTRLALFAQSAQARADSLPSGKLKAEMLKKVDLLERGIWMNDMLIKPGFRP